jgi:hypothetical protein
MLLVKTPDRDLRVLFQLSRMFRNEKLSLTFRIEQLMIELKPFTFSTFQYWNTELLSHARHFAEEVIVLYVSYFYDPSQIPVTYYKREKWIRRHLDEQFSKLFKEIKSRSGGSPEPELITEEPIYYLLQKARERSFPKAPKSKNKRPHLPTLKMRFHVDLACRLDPVGFKDGDRKVLLPYEI